LLLMSGLSLYSIALLWAWAVLTPQHAIASITASLIKHTMQQDNSSFTEHYPIPSIIEQVVITQFSGTQMRHANQASSIYRTRQPLVYITTHHTDQTKQL